jgi:hypothetical protein
VRGGGLYSWGPHAPIRKHARVTYSFETSRLDLSLPTRAEARNRLDNCNSQKAEHRGRPARRQVMEPPESDRSDRRNQVTTCLRHRRQGCAFIGNTLSIYSLKSWTAHNKAKM